MPMPAAISSSGLSFASRAISRSDGNVFIVSGSLYLHAARDALEGLTPPRLGLAHLVKGVDVEPTYLAPRIRERGSYAFYQAIRAVAPGQKEPQKPVAVLLEEPR